MAMSGVEISSEITTLFNDMKLKHTHKWATFKISDDKKRIEIDQVGDAKQTVTKEEDKEAFQELEAQLQEQPRYALYDFRFVSKSKSDRVLEKLYFIVWNPDEGGVKLKMLYASSKDAIKKVFTGLPGEFQVNDRGDLEYDHFAEEIEKKA